METKRTISLQDAVSRIFDGSSIILFPGHESAAIVFEIVRQGKKNLTLFTSSYCFSADLLVRSGAVGRMLTGGRGCWDYPEDTASAIVEVPEGLLCSQLAARLSGVSGTMANVPPRALDVFPELYSKVSGFSDCMAGAVAPDFALLHAARADFAGNVQLDPAENGLASGELLFAQTAKQPLVSVEQIVTQEAIDMNRKQTVLRDTHKPLLVEAPYGAYPCGYLSRYSADEAWLASYRQSRVADSPKVKGLPAFPKGSDWGGYLHQIGFRRLIALTTNRRGE